MKTYVLTLSRFFPATHERKGKPTFFIEKLFACMSEFQKGFKIQNEIEYDWHEYYNAIPKLHTIRGNYELWEKRIKEIQEGKAILSIRYWSGKPYHSKQVEVCQLDKDSGIGVQSLQMTPLGWFIDSLDSDYTSNDLAKNDGLILADFYDWFRGKITIDMEPMAILHFTKFRY